MNEGDRLYSMLGDQLQTVVIQKVRPKTYLATVEGGRASIIISRDTLKASYRKFFATPQLAWEEEVSTIKYRIKVLERDLDQLRDRLTRVLDRMPQ